MEWNMSSAFVDKTLICLDCGAEFEFSVEQQKYFAERGFASEPKRCKVCRDRRKAKERPRPAGALGAFPASPGAATGGNGGGRRGHARARDNGDGQPAAGRDRRRSIGDGQRGPRRELVLHAARCAACGAETQVTFRPVDGRPVYCRDCHYLKLRAEEES